MDTETFHLIEESLNGPLARHPMMQFLQAHGRRMHGSRLPSHILPGPIKMCFKTALGVALRERKQYWEGYAWHRDTGYMPFHHAWCVDTKTQRVVDASWHDLPDAVYLGVYIPTNKLIPILESSGSYGVFDKGRGFNRQAAAKLFGWASTAKLASVRPARQI